MKYLSAVGGLVALFGIGCDKTAEITEASCPTLAEGVTATVVYHQGVGIDYRTVNFRYHEQDLSTVFINAQPPLSHEESATICCKDGKKIHVPLRLDEKVTTE